LGLSVEALKKEGARRIFAACTHPVLSGRAIEKIENSTLERLIATNTIPLGEKARACRKIDVLSVAPLFGEAIRRINEGSSVSSLFV
jgi:ribose-phosphate pyrophosphokinase